jgi:hypothetical protein
VHKARVRQEAGLWHKLGFCYAVVLSMCVLVTAAALSSTHVAQHVRRDFAIAILVRPPRNRPEARAPPQGNIRLSL